MCGDPLSIIIVFLGRRALSPSNQTAKGFHVLKIVHRKMKRVLHGVWRVHIYVLAAYIVEIGSTHHGNDSIVQLCMCRE